MKTFGSDGISYSSARALVDKDRDESRSGEASGAQEGGPAPAEFVHRATFAQLLEQTGKGPERPSFPIQPRRVQLAQVPEREPSDELLATLTGALTKLGHRSCGRHEIKQILSLDKSVPDSAVGRLRVQLLEDPALAGEACAALRHYSAEALAKGSTRMEDKLFRLQLLIVAAPPSLRLPLMTAVRQDLANHSAKIRDKLIEATENGEEIYISQLTIGGGPQGQTIANQAHEFGLCGSNLVVDASSAGDANFGSIRAHLLNSETNSGYFGVSMEAVASALSSQNPVHGSAIQVEDLNPTDSFPTAGDIGDASSIGLYTACQKSAPVLVNTTVIGIEEARGGRGRYRVTMRDNGSGKAFRISTDQICIATGLGKPHVPLKDRASVTYIDEQTERLHAWGNRALPGQAVMHSEDMLRATVAANDDEILDIVRAAPGDITVVGWGDSAKTPLLRIREVAQRAGLTMKELLGDRKIRWIGPKSQGDIEKGLWGPYAGLKPYFDEGIVQVESGRLESIVPAGDTGRSSVTVRRENGEVGVFETGRAILAMGMHNDMGSLLTKLTPLFNDKMKKPVYGNDPVFGDGPLCTKLRVGDKEHDIYFMGMASGLTRPDNTSYLEYFGWKTRLAMEQILMPKVAQDPVSPFEAILPKQAGFRGAAIQEK